MLGSKGAGTGLKQQLFTRSSVQFLCYLSQHLISLSWLSAFPIPPLVAVSELGMLNVKILFHQNLSTGDAERGHGQSPSQEHIPWAFLGSCSPGIQPELQRCLPEASPATAWGMECVCDHPAFSTLALLASWSCWRVPPPSAAFSSAHELWVVLRESQDGLGQKEP